MLNYLVDRNEDFVPFRHFYMDKKFMATDIKENDEAYEFEVELPGYKKEEIKLSLEDGYLTISSENQNESKEDDNQYLRREIVKTSASRSFYVGEVEVDKIEASFEDGILKINVPKQIIEKQNKYIEIK